MKKKSKYHSEYGLLSNLIFVLKSMWRFDKSVIFLIFFMVIIYPISSYIWKIILKFVLDIASGELILSTDKLLFYGGVVFTILLLTGLFSVVCNNEIFRHYTKVRTELIIEKNKKAMEIEYSNLENPDFLDCNQRAEKSCWDEVGLIGLMSDSGEFFKQVFFALFGSVIISTLNIYIVIILIALALLTAFVNNFSNRIAKEKVWDPLALWWRKQSYLKWVTSDFSFAKDVRLFGMQEWLLNKLKALYRVRYNAQKLNEKIWWYTSLCTNFLWIIGQMAIYIWLLILVIKGNLTIGNFTLYLSSSGIFFESVCGITNHFSSLFARSREVDDFRSFMDYEDEYHDDGEIPVPLNCDYSFEFCNVSFKYPGSENYVLKNISLKLNSNESLAIVGINGAGKSTFVKLLLRFYRPTEGVILLNGIDIQQFNRNDYNSLFSAVFQNINVFAFSFEENISLKTSELTDKKRLNEVIEISGLKNCVDNLPAGISTQLSKSISEDGINLSGGESQKLAISRALYKNAPVMILDEPTAALDPLAESKIYQDFEKITKQKTTIYISHRLNSTQFCNNIALFNEGKLIEYGNHFSLLKKNAEYARLFNLQAQYYSKGEK